MNGALQLKSELLIYLSNKYLQKLYTNKKNFYYAHESQHNADIYYLGLKEK